MIERADRPPPKLAKARLWKAQACRGYRQQIPTGRWRVCPAAVHGV